VSESTAKPRYSDPSQQADLYPSEQQSADNSFAVDDAYPVFLEIHPASTDDPTMRNAEDPIVSTGRRATIVVELQPAEELGASPHHASLPSLAR